MPRRDPEKIEIHYLRSFADMTDQKILEIGAGNGRLTWRYADACQQVVAVDPDWASLANAQEDCPPSPQNTVSFLQADALQLPLATHRFDGAILAWSL